MVRVSKRRLSEHVYLRIFDLFFQVISSSGVSKTYFLETMSEILSPTEKIMLAKRITIIFLLLKVIDQQTICQVLKVSSATVSKFFLLINNKESRIVEILNTIIKKEKFQDFIMDFLDDLFTQPGIKIGHWQQYWDNRKRKSRKEHTGL